MKNSLIAIVFFFQAFSACSQEGSYKLELPDSVVTLDDYFFRINVVINNNTEDTITFLNVKDYSSIATIFALSDSTIDNYIDSLILESAESQWYITLKNKKGEIIPPTAEHLLDLGGIQNICYDEAREWAIENNLDPIDVDFEEIDRCIKHKGQSSLHPYTKDSLYLEFGLIDYYMGVMEKGEEYYLTVYYLCANNHLKVLNPNHIKPFKNIFTGCLKSNTIKITSKITDTIR